MSERRSLPLPVFLGGVEATAFLCLFLSPLLGLEIWSGIGFLRPLILGAVLLPGRACARASIDPRSMTGQGFLYQLPFWVAALFFPLLPGQAGQACRALLTQLGLLALLAAVSWWGRKGRHVFSAEGWVGGLSLGWLALRYGWQHQSLPALAILLLVGLTEPLARRKVGWSLGYGQALAVGLGWLAAVVLPTLRGGPFEPELLALWLFQIYLASVLRGLQEQSRATFEDEASLPGVVAARVWLLGRRSLLSALGWFVLPLLLLRSTAGAIGVVVLLTGWYRGVLLAARDRLSADGAVWWLGAEMTLVWAALLSHREASLGALLASMLTALAAGVFGRRSFWRERETASPESKLLERRLYLELRFAAPPDFPSKVRQASDSVELDADLTASAPAGFRERLLQRLRQGETTEEA